MPRRIKYKILRGIFFYMKQRVHYLTLTDKQGQSLRKYDEDKVAKLVATMPMTKWSGSSKGLFVFEGGVFSTQIEIEEQHEDVLFGWVQEICEYRLHWYFERKSEKLAKYHIE